LGWIFGVRRTRLDEENMDKSPVNDFKYRHVENKAKVSVFRIGLSNYGRGLWFSVPYLIFLYGAGQGGGGLFLFLACAGALFGLPWFLMLLPTLVLADVNFPLGHAFFRAVSFGNSEWSALAGWLVFTLGVSVHISGSLVVAKIRKDYYCR
jgi:hypothetical protein